MEKVGGCYKKHDYDVTIQMQITPCQFKDILVAALFRHKFYKEDPKSISNLGTYIDLRLNAKLGYKLTVII